jgi:hypothetical protein
MLPAILELSRKSMFSAVGFHAKLTWGRQVSENPLHLTPYD